MCRTFRAVFFIQCILINFCLGDLSSEKKDQVLNGFVDSLNNLPDQIYTYEDGVLLDAQKTDENAYKISARLKASEIHNLDAVKILKCCGTLVENEDNGLVLQPGHVCTAEPDAPPSQNEGNPEASVEDRTTESTEHGGPVQLYNEVQSDAEVTSGEQFVAIPRVSPSSPCIGCASHVDPNAAGVTELANLGVRHLDLHDPGTKHELRAVVDVERQVQVVNGVRYILSLVIDFNKCTAPDTEPCPISTPCQITILEKPWKKLADGSKYRAIIVNNCTAEWLFGDEGEVLPVPENNENNEIHPDPLNPDGIKVVHNLDVQAIPNQEKEITDEHLKNIEGQIIPYSEFETTVHHVTEKATDKIAASLENREPEHKDEEVRNYNENAAVLPLPTVNEAQPLNEDKRKAIDDMMNFFDFAGFGKPEVTGDHQISKRSSNDARSADPMQKLAKALVDHANRNDKKIKNRVLIDILAAEEDMGNGKHFVYMQTLVAIPCVKAQCTAKDSAKQICNGVIDDTDKKVPSILSAFCYKVNYSFYKKGFVPVDDPILIGLIKHAVYKIESEAPKDNAMKLIKVLHATAQKASGTLTKISMILAYTNCKKTVDFYDRMTCNIIEELGTNVCEVEMYGKDIDKNLQISYVCTERDVDESSTDSELSKSENSNIYVLENNAVPALNKKHKVYNEKMYPGNKQEKNVDDLKYKALALESFNDFRKSHIGENVNVKDIQVTKVTTQVVSGKLTKIDYKVLPTEGDAISCHSKIWEQSWLQKKEINVNCDLGNRKIRNTRSIPGGEEVQDVDDQKYKDLALESFNKYRKSTVGGADLNIKEMKVTKVTTQVVAGSITRIDFTVLPTDGDTITCHSKIFEQVWLKKKEIDVACDLRNSKIRKARGTPVLGGQQEQSINDQKYKDLALESFNKYRETQVGGGEFSVKEIKVTKVTTQVVAGSITRIDFDVLPANGDTITCHSKIFEQVWLKKKEIDVNCNINNQKKRNTRGIPGGEEEQDIGDQKYKDLALESFNKYRETQVGGSELSVKEIKVTKVTTQVVAGSITRIDFDVLPTNGDTITCHSEILEQVWLKKKDIDVNCNINNQTKRNTRGIPGGEEEQDIGDQKYKDLALESFNKYRETQVGGSELFVKEIKVTKVTTQVVAGSITRIDFTVLPTDGDTITCHSKIFEQVWLKKKEIDVACDLRNSKIRKTRGTPVLGGQQEQSINDQKYKDLALESFNKYRETQVGGGEFSVKEIKVTKVTTQVVAGSITRIDFDVLPANGDTITCHSKIFEQVWLKKKEIDVNCDLNNQKNRNKRGIPGGEQEQDIGDQKYKDLALESFNKYRETQVGGGELSVKEIKVTKVTTQVVAGSITRIDFDVLPTNGDTITCHSEIFEQVWLKKKDIDVNCDINNQKKRNTRGIPGGEEEQDIGDQKYKDLALESFNKYRETQVGGSELSVKEIKVTKVTTQVVAGSITRIDFDVLPTNGDTITCHSKIFEQVWLKKKEIDVNCDINNQKKRNTRGIPGGEEEQDIGDQKYKDLALESFNKYRETQVGGGELSVKEIKVTKVTTQVVAGSITRIDFDVLPTNGDTITCHSEIFEQVWLKKKDIDVNCDISNQKKRNKRGIRGGQQEQSINDQKYKDLALESFNKYRQTQVGGSELSVKEINVTKVTTQVVAGSITRIDFDVLPTNGDTITCHSEILEQVWLKKKDIDVNCNINNQKKRITRGIPGGEEEQDIGDQKYKDLALESFNKYRETQLGGGEFSVKEIKVTKVTTQVVAGSITRIDFDVLPTNGDTITCHSKIFEQVWLKKKEIDVNCDANKQVNKRSLKGGQKEQDVNDEKYKALAQESFEKYSMTLVGGKLYVKELKVTKVTTQVVSGSMTRIDFNVFATNDDQITCHSKIWEQPWLNKKEIDVNCDVNKQVKKRSLKGGQKEQDVNDEKYKALAQESFEKYSTTVVGGMLYVKELKITKVTTQVVSGSMTRIDFNVFATNGDQITCHSKIWEQPWLNKKEIDVNCDVNKQVKKRSLPGGQKEENINDQKYITLAHESLAEYRKSLVGGELNIKELKVTKVTTQIVSGMITRIDFVVYPTNGDVITCQSKVHEQAWLNKKEITVNCGLKDQETRNKRAIFSNNPEKFKTGSMKKEDANKAQFQLLANESLQRYMKLQDNPKHHEVVDVTHVVSQVVSGMLYEIDFTAGPASCSIKGANQTTCILQNETLLLCHSRVWSRPWLKSNEINVTCERSTNAEELNDLQFQKESKHGEKFLQEKNYKDLAEEVLHYYERQSNSKYKYKVISVEHSYEQITDSILTMIRFYASPTQCLINDETSVDKCKLRKPEVVLLCKSTVRERPWLYFKDIKVTCTDVKTAEATPTNWYDETPSVESVEVNHRSKRYVTGDDADDYIDDDMKFYYADRAIQYINDRIETHNLQKLITILSVDASTHMGARMIRMYIETAMTFCVRHQIGRVDINQCDEMDGLPHKLCHVRLWPSPNEEMVIRHVVVLCDDHPAFTTVTGLDISKLISASLRKLESSPSIKYKLVHQGEPYVMPSLSSKYPLKMNFIVLRTNCTKDIDVFKTRDTCFLDTTSPATSCESQIYLSPDSKEIKHIKAKCTEAHRQRRDVSANTTKSVEDETIVKLIDESLEKLETSSLHRYKQRLIKIIGYNTQITRGRLTTIKFDVGYSSCLKYESIRNISDCQILEHLPKRHCTSQVFERLWVENSKNIEVSCEDEDTPLDSQTSALNTETANDIANEALKHIEAKYPNPKRLKVVRIFSLQKQAIAGIHYRLKMEVGITDCPALSVEQTDCKLVKGNEVNKFCRVNVWIRPWTDHPPNYRVTCDYQEAESLEIYHQMQAEHLFAHYIRTHKPDYMNDHKEMARRFKIFRDNVRKVHELNVHERGSATYGMTRFSDLTYEEFSKKYLGLKPSLRNENDIPMIKADIPKVDAPQSFDWRDRGAVTDVKDQGSCGSCWAFSVTGNVEGQWKLHSGKLVSLSEQELVDCDKKDQGCNGGLMDNAYRAIEELGGLETESDYPYEGADDKCVFNQTLSRVQISGAVNISSNETEMAQWLVTGGPMSIGINANAMQFYVGGISHPWKMLCSPNNLDHGVLIVGYGVKNYPLFNKRLPFWIVKNSWGKSWGEQGYYRVYRGDGTCGVNQMASSAVV